MNFIKRADKVNAMIFIILPEVDEVITFT